MYVRTYSSVRGVQYMLDVKQNTKIPEGLFHKLYFDMCRIQFGPFCGHPFNF